MAASSQNAQTGSLPSLSQIVSFLLASKRSLNCADHLSRANEIVTATRHAIVQQTALQARTSFLLSGCAAQVTILEQLHSQLNAILQETTEEFDQVVKGVETFEARLNEILTGLRNTIVDRNLRPEDEEPKNLLDFVEANSVQALLEEIWAGIEDSRKARTQFAGTVATIAHDIDAVKAGLTECEALTGTANAEQLSALLQNLETSAHEMAENFESLVKHYDLCVNALKHMEGAGAALHQAPNNDLSDAQNAALAHEIEAAMAADERDGKEGPDSVSAEDHQHMLALLSDDAQQVEEVIEDIRESLSDMETSHASALRSVKQTNQIHQQAISGFRALEAVGAQLAQYATQSHLFVMHTDDEKARVAERQTQLGELAGFYAGFLGAYDNLIIEVGRRKDVARRMKRLQEEALTKLEKLYQEDVEERELFRASQGEFLPMDIWPGLMAPAPRYDIGLVEGHGSVPDISASVIQKAIRRVSARPASKD